jgi:hypothetical protein
MGITDVGCKTEHESILGLKQKSFPVYYTQIRGWKSGSSGKNTCLASTRPWVQTTGLPKKPRSYKNYQCMI